MTSYHELRQELSDRVYPFLIEALKEAEIENFDMDGGFYNPDGSKLTSHNQLASMTQAAAYYFPDQKKRLAVVISPNGMRDASVNVITPPEAARHTIHVTKEDLEPAWRAIQLAIKEVVATI